MVRQSLARKKIIGQGSYGCAVKPSLHCKEKVDMAGKISKILLIKDANDELQQTVNIDKIDPGLLYHLRRPTLCNPKLSLDDISLLRNCNAQGLETRKSIEGAALLVYDDGGETWESFSEKETLQVVDIYDFLISAYTVVRGVQHMLEHGYMHGDLKYNNVLYNAATKRCNMIDFGHSNYINKIRTVERKTHVRVGTSNLWWPFTSPERNFQYKSVYDTLKIGLNKDLPAYVSLMKKTRGYQAYNMFFFGPEEIHVSANNDIVKLLEYLKKKGNDDSSYNTFLDETLQVLDSYFIAFSLVCVTYNLIKHSRSKIRNNEPCFDLINAIRKLARQASRIDPQTRLSAHEFASQYESTIIMNNNIKENANLPDQSPLDYKTSIKTLIYPDGRFAFPRIKKNAAWIRDSETVSLYEDILKLNLTDFVDLVKTVDSVDSVDYVDSVDSKSRRIVAFRKYATGNKIQNPNTNYSPSVYANVSKDSKDSPDSRDASEWRIYNNIRGPQKSNLGPELDFSSSKKEGFMTFHTEYLKLLGSRYSVVIKFLDERDEFKTPVPRILIDPTTLDIYVQMNSDTSVLIPQTIQQTNNYDSSKIPTTATCNLSHEIDLLKRNAGVSGNLLITLLIIELACMALILNINDSFIPTMVSRLKSIIGLPNQPRIEPSSKKNRIDDVAVTASVFQDALVRNLKKCCSTNIKLFFEAYNARIQLSLMRGEVASETEAIRRFRNSLGFPEHGTSRRDHLAIANLHKYYQENVLAKGNEVYTLSGEDIASVVLESLERLKNATDGMLEDDIVFSFRGRPVSKKFIDEMFQTRLRNLDGMDVLCSSAFDNNILHMNRIADNHLKQKKVKFYTQLQIDTMLVLWPQDFETEFNNLVEFLVADKSNTVYVCFEDRSKQSKSKYLLYGFCAQQLQSSTLNTKSNSNITTASESITIKLFAMVPEPSMFPLLDPVSWTFINKLKEKLIINYKTIAAGVGKPISENSIQFKLVKVLNKNLQKSLYNTGNAFLSQHWVLFQVRLLAEGKFEQLDISNDENTKIQGEIKRYANNLEFFRLQHFLFE